MTVSLNMPRWMNVAHQLMPNQQKIAQAVKDYKDIAKQAYEHRDIVKWLYKHQGISAQMNSKKGWH